MLSPSLELPMNPLLIVNMAKLNLRDGQRAHSVSERLMSSVIVGISKPFLIWAVSLQSII